MKAATVKLLSDFVALAVEEKKEFVQELIHHLPPWDSGPLSDGVAAAAGDPLAVRVSKEGGAVTGQRKARLVRDGCDLLLVASSDAPPMSPENVKRMLEDLP